MDYKIEERELEKLMRILASLNIDIDVIKWLCKVDKLSELNKIQYNYLLYILCLKWGDKYA